MHVGSRRKKEAKEGTRGGNKDSNGRKRKRYSRGNLSPDAWKIKGEKLYLQKYYQTRTRSPSLQKCRMARRMQTNDTRENAVACGQTSGETHLGHLDTRVT